ncbi:hypothetical protein AKJ40_02715 [candidate division MSBL1 archaeon SCGC-AAA259M10]|uniref:TerB N-terminal domain-containing protein n=1 Tax=candidate division MSBL1 archaeon SCGC-AAA259M10 TaxID=1698270 RepID=A0A133UZJ7_9EURY|nr:hypothetical protein AKJ40_02715 [candidate division MSBL1 archaeon SCGC-AAA259M10]
MNSEPRKSEKYSNVPEFETHFPSISDMSKEQESFYKHWLRRWKENDPIDVEGNISYLFVYVYDVLSWIRENRFEDVISELEKIRKVYKHEEKIYRSLGGWIADTYIIKGEYKKALEVQKSASLKLTNDKYLSLKRNLGLSLDGEDALSICRKKDLTDYGRAHREKVEKALTKVLREYENKNQTKLIEDFTNRHRNENLPGEFPLYNATPGIIPFENQYIDDLNYYKLDLKKARNVLTQENREGLSLIRKAENIARS